MTERTVRHSTIVVERSYDVPASRVYAAWSDVAQRRQWDVPGDDWVIHEHQQDFRIGGRESSRFGPKGGPVYKSEGSYLDIVPNARIISAGTMHSGETRISTTLCTIELIADGSRTRVIVTDQSAFLDDLEKPDDRAGGWGSILDNLEAYFKKRAAAN